MTVEQKVAVTVVARVAMMADKRAESLVANLVA